MNVTAIDPTGAGDVFVASFMASGVLDWPIEQRLRLAGTRRRPCPSARLGGAASAPHPCDITQFLTDQSPPGDWSTIRSWAATQAHAH